MRALQVLLTLLLTGLISFSAFGAETYLGIYSQVSDDPPGLLIDVMRESPAAIAGLKTGDVITAIDGAKLASSETPFGKQLTSHLEGKQVGDVVVFTVYRNSPKIKLNVAGKDVETDYPVYDVQEAIENAGNEQVVLLTAVRHAVSLNISVTLGVRPDTVGARFIDNAKLDCDLPDYDPRLREILNSLVAHGISEQPGRESRSLDQTPDVAVDTEDLYARLAERAAPDDGYKLQRTVYLLRDGLKGEAVTRAVTDGIEVNARAGLDGYYDIQIQAAEMLDISSIYATAPALRTGLSAEEHLDILELIIKTAAIYVYNAFLDFSDEELEFMASQRDVLSEVFREHHYVDREDEDIRRIPDNLRLIEMAKRIDYEQLLLAQLTLAQIAESHYLEGMKADLQAQFADRLGDRELLSRDTVIGKLVISGNGRTWWQPGENIALLIDLGGDDFYTAPAGSGRGVDNPIGVLIEMGGNDAYESSMPYSQGSGSLGCGLLIDLAGNDQYVGLEWSQGCGYFGCGALLDFSGDDVYRGEEFCTAASIFGSGVVIDYSGNDRMEAQMKSQAFGGANGVGLLIDVAGDDYRYAKGKYPTGYGDPGIFDAWSQGCAMGFRTIASGGIAGVIDLGGADYNEAGNFSQGGGYYFGYGFFHDRGWEDDKYIGSRYNQGFCAHQAVGVFLEDGGDDWYHTRQAVAQGLAWDECATMFVDYGGDDIYEGGGGFSQGASAHNSLCVMWDRGGNDRYIYPSSQARAGGNDYHGGTSLSIFIDEGGGLDTYDSVRSGNDLVTGWPEYGFFVDLPASLETALNGDNWVKLFREFKE